MYYDYFGISESPFSITPDPRYLYMSKGHHEALAHLLFGVSENGGFVLLTGEVGTGKTSVCRCLLEQLPDTAEVALILNPRLNELELLAGICDELDIAYPKDTTSLKVMVDVLNSHLLDIHAKGRHAVVVIDEAQNLSAGVLEQVRLLTNLETDTRKLLQIILIGQPELFENLRRTEMRQLAQRVTAHYHLEPLGQTETPGYIRYRLAVGGLSPETFTARAAAAVHKRSGGIPRIINSICDRCLLGAYAQNQKVIDHRLVRSASKEVFGSPHKDKKVLAMRWPVAAAVAALLVLVFTPAVFGLFAQPLDWGIKVDGLLFSDSPTAKPEAAPRAERAVAEFKRDAASKTTPAAAPNAKVEPKAAGPSAQVPEATPKPAIQSGQTLGARNKPETEKPKTSMQETVLGATYLSGGVLAPAAAPEGSTDDDSSSTRSPAKPAKETAPSVISPAAAPAKPVNERTPSAPQAALAPAVRQPTDLANGNSSSHVGGVNGHAASQACHLPSGAGNNTQIDLGELLRDPAALQNEQAGMELLFNCWDVEFRRIDSGAPCSKSTNGGLECLKGKTGWKTLALINRPAMITLVGPKGERSHAVVSAMNGTRVTLLSGEHRIETDTTMVERYWTGEYLILWRPPPLYFRLLARGARGEDVAWLKNRFAELNDEPATPEKVTTFDSQLYERVVAFQEERRLTADGIVGARTLIHINTATSDPPAPVLYDTEPSTVASE